MFLSFYSNSGKEPAPPAGPALFSPAPQLSWRGFPAKRLCTLTKREQHHTLLQIISCNINSSRNLLNLIYELTMATLQHIKGLLASNRAVDYPLTKPILWSRMHSSDSVITAHITVGFCLRAGPLMLSYEIQVVEVLSDQLGFEAG